MKKVIISLLLIVLMLSLIGLYYQSYIANKRENELKLKLLTETQERLQRTEELLTLDEEPMPKTAGSKNKNKRFIVVPETAMSEMVLNQRKMQEDLNYLRGQRK